MASWRVTEHAPGKCPISEVVQGWPASYIGDLNCPVEQHARKDERLWPLASIVQALCGAGLILEHLGEHPDPYWNAFPNLDATLARRIPLTFSLRARRPAQP